LRQGMTTKKRALERGLEEQKEGCQAAEAVDWPITESPGGFHKLGRENEKLRSRS